MQLHELKMQRVQVEVVTWPNACCSIDLITPSLKSMGSFALPNTSMVSIYE